jgi:hypothetical protein
MDVQVENDTILRSTTNVICHKFPEEIWRQIFGECVRYIPRALTPLSCSFDIPEQKKHPYTNIAISHVCRHFRYIALSTPVLWSTLNFDGSISEIESFLERSGRLPLTITSIRDSFDQKYSRYSDIFHFLQKQIVGIDTPVGEYNFKLIDSCKNLKHLILSDMWGTYLGYSPAVLIEEVLDEFKYLENLCWKREHAPPLSLSSQKKYPLRSLQLTFKVSDTALLSMVRCCPALENLSARVETLNSRTYIQDDVDICLPQLRDLRVQFIGDDLWLCELYVPPILDHLEFDYDIIYPKSRHRQWNMRTKSLVLGTYFDLESIVSWLASEPKALKTLTLRIEKRDQKDILEALKADGQQVLCPKLEHVDICFPLPSTPKSQPPSHIIRDYEEVIEDVIISRLQAGLPLLRFTLNGEAIMLEERVARELIVGFGDTK